MSERSADTQWGGVDKYAYPLTDEEKQCGCVACPPGQELYAFLYARNDHWTGAYKGKDFFQCRPKGSNLNGVRVSPAFFEKNTGMKTCGGDVQMAPTFAIKRQRETVNDIYMMPINKEQRFQIKCDIWKISSCFTINKERKCLTSKRLFFHEATQNRHPPTFTVTKNDLTSALTSSDSRYDKLKKLHNEVGLCALPALVS